MAKRRVLPTIDAHYDADGISFTCDGEAIEDMELSWEDLDDSELVAELAEELVEYIDADDLVNVDNPAGTVRRVLRQLSGSRRARRKTGDEVDDLEPDDDTDDEQSFDEYDD
jgi:hypothetical protein